MTVTYLSSCARRGAPGGETSGTSSASTNHTGDGLVSALQVLCVLKQSGRTLAELAAGMTRYPQTLVNVRVHQKIDLKNAAPIQAAVARAEQQLGARGRVVLRASGTEPLVRVMVEGEDHAEVEFLADDIAASVRGVAPA